MSTIQQATRKENFVFAPNNISEICKFAEYIKGSALLPTSFLNKPADIVLGILICLRLGLDPIMGLHSLKMSNGKIVMNTDAMLSLVKAHPDCEDIQEMFDEKTMTATCIIKRKNNAEVVRTFSKKDAEIAKLWMKEKSPWVTYPTRMLQMRARGFALRDSFPDALNGILPQEEVEDYENFNKKTVTQVTPIAPSVKTIAESFEQNANASQEILDAHVVIDETPLDKKLKEMEQEINSFTLQGYLEDLIKEKNVPDDLVGKWLKKENVDDVINLSHYAANKCIEYIEEHY